MTSLERKRSEAMPQLPGLVAMPTVVFNAALSLLPDRSRTVRGPDRLAVVSPMFNEDAGASRALSSILAQRKPVDQVFISINGGGDRTPEVVAETLARFAYLCADDRHDFQLGAAWQRWTREGGGPEVVVLVYSAQISKATSINRLLDSGWVDAERVLVVDGDTVLDPGFVESLGDHFYRLKRERHGRGWRHVIEDVALQSGAVLSRPPHQAGWQAEWISKGRSAEYAFATVVRTGQTRRLGRGPTFGSSRLFTVVGCGFAARRDAFPVPTGTQTEDHDFSLLVQGGGSRERMVSVEGLQQRGFRVVVDGLEVSPRDFFRDEDEVLLRQVSDARLVHAARMYTDDPLRLPGYLNQVERWTGGGLENALRRVFDRSIWQTLKPNVRFTVLSAQLEHLLGLLLLVTIPILAGLNVARPGWGLAPTGVLWWLLLDLLATALLVFMGYVRLERARGSPPLRSTFRAFGTTLLTVPMLISLRPVNAVCYLTSVIRVLPAFFTRRSSVEQAEVTWERPRSIIRQRAPLRTTGVAATMVLSGLTVFLIVVGVASYLLPADRDVYRMIYASPRVEAEDHVFLPVLQVWSNEPRAPGHSQYCRPGDVPGTGESRRSLADDAPDYLPLNPWGLITLARLTPLLVHLEEAASAYDVSADLLLRVLINESYLDPLAVGETGDLGLSQVTSDALTLLRAIANDQGSVYANERFFAVAFSVFDPDFSICAGAAKLAWAGSQAGGEDERIAYARYINPIDGVVRGAVSERHTPLVEGVFHVKPMVDTLAATVAAYRLDPQSVEALERAFLDIAASMEQGHIDLPEAYAQTAELVRVHGISDADFYDRVIEGLYASEGLWAQSTLE